MNIIEMLIVGAALDWLTTEGPMTEQQWWAARSLVSWREMKTVLELKGG